MFKIVNSRLLSPLLFLWAMAPCAQALDPATPLAAYRHDRWTEVDGAPRLIDALARTADGWLWVASRQSGLYRFDGVRFIPFQTRDGSRLQRTSISVLQPDRDDALWIGHGTGGVSVLRDGRLQHVLAPPQTGSVFAIAHAPDGATWVASRFGLFRIRDGKAERIGAAQGYDSARAEYVLADRSGRVWASDSDYLYVLDAGATRFRNVRRAEVDPMLVEAHDGSVWLVLGKQFDRVAPPAAPKVPAVPGIANSFQSAFDGDGNLWSGNCPVGLCVLRPAAWQGRQTFSALAGSERLDQPWQLTSLSIPSVLADRDGSLWFGTAAGLERLRDQPVHMVADMFDQGQVYLQPHPDGSIVMLEVRRMNGAVALWRLVDGRRVPLPNPLSAQVMARAPDGSLVLAGSGGIERHYAARVERLPLPPIAAPAGKLLHFRNLAAGNDELWASIAGQGVWHYRDGTWTRPEPSGKGPVAITVDGAGNRYLGYANNLLRTVEKGQPRTYTAADGIEVGDIRFVDAADVLFVSGDQGSAIRHGGRFRMLRTTPPGGLGIVSGIAVDPRGDRWLNAANGLFHVTAADWARTLADPGVPLRGRLFDALDGYVGGAETDWLRQTVFAAPDGKLWFAGARGPAWLALDRLMPNPATPDARILAVHADGVGYRPDGPVALAKGSTAFQIDYASPSLRAPQRVTFRYRLRGAEDTWEDAGTRRSAFYKNMRPGDYTFEVVAFNENGVASARAGTLHVRIPPTLTQTWWFRAACIVAVLALLMLAFRLRLRHLAARLEERFRIRVAEREAVARALHDTFLQSVQGLLLSMHSATVKLPADTPARADFEKLLQRAEDVLVEGRDEVQGLRSAFASGAHFWSVLQRDVELMVPGGLARVTIVHAGVLDQLAARHWHDVYAIVREAVSNALRHTEGPVTVTANAGPKAFMVSIEDVGAGLGEFFGGRHGHFGLQGIRERAAGIGAKLELRERDGGGTCVLLAIPASLAYET